MKFVKMEGLGNDFILTHGLTKREFGAAVKKTAILCDRRRGIGADGLIFILPPRDKNADYLMRIFNADGTEAQMCGNGIRCCALYLNEMKLSARKSFSIQTRAGIIKTTKAGTRIRVDMGAPVLDAEKIPTVKSGGTVIMEPISTGDRKFSVTAVSMGNPHAVVYADTITDELVLGYGPKIQNHPLFPQKANIEFVTVLSDKEITMRVFERGCGETLACGTGACAAVVAGVLNKKHGKKVTVHLPGGGLLIEWDGNAQHPVFMTGPAKIVYSGCYNGI